MADIPLFFPTRKGEAAGIVSLPNEGSIGSTAVLLFTGDAHSRTRVGILRNVAKDLAASGYPTLRFDYPGAGLSASEAPPRQEELGDVAMDAAAWFLDETACTTLVTAGHCLGARLALLVAAHNEAVTRAVAVGCPVRRRKVSRSPVLTRLAAKSNLGPVVAGVLARGPRTKSIEPEWYPGLLEEIRAASVRAQLGFIYGSEDDFYRDFLELQEELEPSLRTKVSVSVREGVQLRALTELEHHPWVTAEIEKLLGHSVGEPAHG